MMFTSYAAMAASAPPPPSPAQRMQELRRFFASLAPHLVLSDCLGFQAIRTIPERIAALWEHAVVVGVDTEAWTINTNEMTEIGLVIFERRDMIELQKGEENPGKDIKPEGKDYDHLGPFGEELLKQIRFHHLRIVETAHLKTNSTYMRGPEGNRFGHTRFVTFAEARSILTSIFVQKIGTPDSKLAGCQRPIVLIGHATHHDGEHCRSGLGYDWFQHGTIVKSIDTQPLAKATRTWVSPNNQRSDVGLDRLTRILGFKHQDPHTACNDAARTVIAAIQMVLPRACKTATSRSMQDVASAIEKYSRDTSRSTWGTKHCCTRCGARDHNENTCIVQVHCQACHALGCAVQDIVAHIDMYCPHIARYKAHLRRRDDALRRGKRVPDEPTNAHPAVDEHLYSDPGYWSKRSFVVIDDEFPPLPRSRVKENEDGTKSKVA